MYEVSTRGSTLVTKGDIHKNQGNRSSPGTTTMPQCLLCLDDTTLGIVNKLGKKTTNSGYRLFVKTRFAIIVSSLWPLCKRPD